jgi:hypothetical protein
MPEAEAHAQVDHWLDWQELTGEFELLFDNPAIDATTVADLLRDRDLECGASTSRNRLIASVSSCSPSASHSSTLKLESSSR